ncbi:hypothetical protein [Streptomyces caniscabiei]|uniref:hypothetical protein n=1 Tax=Streptomyces caniscabiei TaxID=2746961 RepID=UPI0015C50403|nr:hypothetical protein [Streptomyces caniscabiei]
MTGLSDQSAEHLDTGPCTAPAVRYAVFDLDGTLHPEVLGILLLRDLHAAGICRREPVERLFTFLSGFDQERLHEPDRVATAYQLFAKALQGCEFRQVRLVARLLWERAAARLPLRPAAS